MGQMLLFNLAGRPVSRSETLLVSERCVRPLVADYLPLRFDTDYAGEHPCDVTPQYPYSGAIRSLSLPLPTGLRPMGIPRPIEPFSTRNRQVVTLQSCGDPS